MSLCVRALLISADGATRKMQLTELLPEVRTALHFLCATGFRKEPIELPRPEFHYRRYKLIHYTFDEWWDEYRAEYQEVQ